MYRTWGCLFLHRLTRPAPSELPQGRNAARVRGCSGAMSAIFVLHYLDVGLLPFITIKFQFLSLHSPKHIVYDMKFFIDTANLDQIKEARDLGILDGVTTNPSLMAKEGITGESPY